MAVTSAQIVDFLLANPGMTDAQIVAAMETKFLLLKWLRLLA